MLLGVNLAKEDLNNGLVVAKRARCMEWCPEIGIGQIPGTAHSNNVFVHCVSQTGPMYSHHVIAKAARTFVHQQFGGTSVRQYSLEA